MHKYSDSLSILKYKFIQWYTPCFKDNPDCYKLLLLVHVGKIFFLFNLRLINGIGGKTKISNKGQLREIIEEPQSLVI